MRLKVLVPASIAGLTLLLGLGSAVAEPVLLTVDSSASALSGVALGGTIAGNFDSAVQSLSFAGGSDIFLTGNLAGAGVIPKQQFNNAGGTITVVSSFQTNVSSLHLDLTAGTAVNGGDASSVTFAGVAVGTVSGVADVDFDILGQGGSTTLNFSAPLTTSATFNPSAGIGAIGLSASAGLLLTLPFDVELILGDLSVSGGGVLGELLAPVVSFLDASLQGQIVPLTGLLIARGDLPAAVPEPATWALLLSAMLLLGFRRARAAAARGRNQDI